ncbi:hypothetical protein O1611_g7529 [Lasiodiplodia mahajangana]|uniref:Uncharacterized protein n=1 Tax=Lasiodiplodia mahajangana TaxID=1108764 RepID=A0ACC2JF68_9PEZI|nr:hypothetical protein O1611_g7529 [Lasiodiplodia mahajangana]
MRRTISRLAHLSPRNAHVKPRPAPVNVSNSDSWDNPTGEVQLGQHVISVCKQYDISLPQHVRRVSVGLRPNPYQLNVAISPKHSFSVPSMQYFDKFEHPFAKTMLAHYIEKKKEPLWISCFAYGASPFPSRKASKKVAHALRDALAAAGYDRFGRRVPVDGKPNAVLDLYGTLRVTSNDPCAVCNAKFVDLLVHAKQIISYAEISLRRGKNGLHLQSQSRPHSAGQDQKREFSNRQWHRTAEPSTSPHENRSRYQSRHGHNTSPIQHRKSRL